MTGPRRTAGTEANDGGKQPFYLTEIRAEQFDSRRAQMVAIDQMPSFQGIDLLRPLYPP